MKIYENLNFFGVTRVSLSYKWRFCSFSFIAEVPFKVGKSSSLRRSKNKLKMKEKSIYR
jgi:hypothetical protein